MIRQPEFFQTMGIAESKRYHKVYIIRKIIMDINEKAIELHKLWKGKLETTSKVHIMSKEDLSILYTPGVAAPCKEIAKDKETVYTYTTKANTIAVVSDGSAVLGLGNIGPYAAMPVMEGKAALFKEFGNVNAVPICLETQAFPGNLKYSHFPSSILKKGEKFNSVTSYKFI